MAVGEQLTHKRLQSRLISHEFELFFITDIGEAYRFQSSNQVDVILIDSLFDRAGEAIHAFGLQPQIPVVLLVHEPVGNWKTLNHLHADGYIPENSGNSELIARIKAIARRSTIKN